MWLLLDSINRRKATLIRDWIQLSFLLLWHLVSAQLMIFQKPKNQTYQAEVRKGDGL